jgi:hypothetical protein
MHPGYEAMCATAQIHGAGGELPIDRCHITTIGFAVHLPWGGIVQEMKLEDKINPEAYLALFHRDSHQQRQSSTTFPDGCVSLCRNSGGSSWCKNGMTDAQIATAQSTKSVTIHGNFICAKRIMSAKHLVAEKDNDRRVLSALSGCQSCWKIHVGEEKEQPSKVWNSAAVVRGLKTDENLHRLKMRQYNDIDSEETADTATNTYARYSLYLVYQKSQVLWRGGGDFCWTKIQVLRIRDGVPASGPGCRLLC